MLVPRLVLVPEDPNWVPESNRQLAEAMIEIGLADRIESEQPMYLHAGKQFLDHIMFLGCAPTVEFEPGDYEAWGTGRFYHLYIPGPLNRPRFRSDSMSYKPRCPSCKKPVDEWKQWWSGGDLQAHACTGCGTELTPNSFNWRKRAGLGRCFIDVLGIHPETVKPASSIFDVLERSTGTKWRYFFVEDEFQAP